MKWKTVRNTGGYVDLDGSLCARQRRTSHRISISKLNRPSIRRRRSFIGNDDGAKIWLNGEKVFENRDHVAATPERNKASVKLKKGVNTVLMKIVNGRRPAWVLFEYLIGAGIEDSADEIEKSRLLAQRDWFLP